MIVMILLDGANPHEEAMFGRLEAMPAVLKMFASELMRGKYASDQKV